MDAKPREVQFPSQPQGFIWEIRAKVVAASRLLGLSRPLEPQRDGRAGVLIRLDGLLHEIRTAGGHPEFEEALRRARRILARSHAE